MGRGRKREEDRTLAPTQPRQQSSQAVASAVTQTAPATHEPGAGAQCCCALHPSVCPEPWLVLRTSMQCSLASEGCRISPEEAPSVLRQPIVGWSSRHPYLTQLLTSMRSWSHGTCAPKYHTIIFLSSPPPHSMWFLEGGRSLN